MSTLHPTLIDHLRSLGLSSRESRDALATGKVLLRGIPTADGGRTVEPEEVRVAPNAPRLVPGRDPVIVHKDAHLAVVWKPSGMLSVPAPRRSDANVLGFVGRILGRALPVHRIDEGTSGLLLVALDEGVQADLKALFEAHTIERTYLAIAKGHLREAERVQSELVRDRGDGKRGSGAGGKRALTHLRPLERLRGATLVEAQLETGRTHQVRIHLAERGHPILGDRLYADPHTARRLPRLGLHAWSLGFVHPVTREPFDLRSPLADDLERWRRRNGGAR